MSDARLGKPSGGEPVDRPSGGVVLLAAPAKTPPPQPANTAPDGAQCLDIVGHGVICISQDLIGQTVLAV
jgi:hypothetical protein